MICASLPVKAPPVLFHTFAKKFLNLSHPDKEGFSWVAVGIEGLSAVDPGTEGLLKED